MKINKILILVLMMALLVTGGIPVLLPSLLMGQRRLPIPGTSLLLNRD